jgi:hypothetical protein
MAGLDLPGVVAAPDRSDDAVRIVVALTFVVVGIGGIALLMAYRPPMRAA